MEKVQRPHILVLSHGYLGQEMIKSAEMIMGEIEDIHFISLTNQVTIDEYRDCVKQKICEMPEGSIVLADLFGGTPCNTAAIISRNIPVHLIAGFNLSLLIECVQMREEYSGLELCEVAIENVEGSMLVVKI